MFESRGHGFVVQHGEVAFLSFGRRGGRVRLFQSVQDKVGVAVRQEPQTIWSGSVELSVHVIQRTESRPVAARLHKGLPRIARRRRYCALAGPPCIARRRHPPAATAARPCARHRRGSSPPTRAGSRPSDQRRGGSWLHPQKMGRSRAPPGRNKPTPCEGSHSPTGVLSSHAKRFQTFGNFARNAATHPAVDLCLLDPFIERSGVQPIFTAIEVTVAPAREDPLVIENQPNGVRPHFG